MSKLIHSLLFSLLFVGCACAQTTTEQDSFAYFCPPCNADCDKLSFNKAGKCSHCGMKLVRQSISERKIKLNEKKMTIAFYLQDGVEVLDFAGPMEVFSYAGFNIFTVSKTKKQITSQGILKIMPDFSIDDAPPADILAFFGGNAGAASNDSAEIGRAHV